MLLFGCGDDDDDGAPPGEDAGADAAAGRDAGVDAAVDDDCVPPAHDPQPALCSGAPAAGVAVDEWLVDVPHAAANPVTAEETPAALDRVRVMRYRADPEVEALDGVLVLVPGFLAGASSFDGIARGVVARSSGRYEVWALDRRSNLLEDLTGMQAAEAAEDPEIASAYYFDGAEVDGRTFEGLPAQEDLGYVSEWGLVTLMSDLQAVLERVPEDRRQTNLFLGGHSLGGAIVEIASAWDVGGEALGAQLAGIIPMDGTINGVGLGRDDYHDGVAGGLVPVLGVDGLRDGSEDRTTMLPLLDPTLFISVEISGMRAFWDPAGFACDEQIGSFFQTLYSIRPWVTNAGVLGLAFDDQYAVVSIFAMRIGESFGGTFEQVDLPSFGLSYAAPNDPEAVYSWRERDDDLVCLRSLARATFQGPTNFTEWLFPSRLGLDVRAVADLAVSSDGGDYRFDEEGLVVTRAAVMDAPVLAIAAGAGVAPDAAAYEPYRLAIAPTTRDGATRDEDAGFRAVVLPAFEHLDAVMSEADEPVASMLEFLDAHHEGTVTLP